MSDKNKRQVREEISRPQPRHVARELTATEYEDLDDRYYYDRNLQPEGMTYEWKRYSVLGKEDRQYMARMLRQGWKPVPGERHPETGGYGEEPIIIDGQILMERDTVSVEIAKNKVLRDSIAGQKDHFKRLKLETPASALTLKKSYERPEVAQSIPE